MTSEAEKDVILDDFVDKDSLKEGESTKQLDAERLENDKEFQDTEEYHDAEDEEEEKDAKIMLDDFVDEDLLKEEESILTIEQLQERFKSAKEFKESGNKEYQEDKVEDSIKSYTKALQLCPLNEKEYRAILYGNRAAAKIKFGAKENAVMDCTKSLEYNSNYMKSLIRRAKLYEEMDKLDEALKDYKQIFELDPSNREAFGATQRLPPIISERNEKMKEEMMGKLKDLGNLCLRPFGLSTNNFQLQPTETGGYTINFKQ